MKNSLFIIVVIFVFSLVAYASEIETRAFEGEAIIQGNDTESATKNARLDAIWKALWYTSSITSETEMKNFVITKDVVKTKSKGSIEDIQFIYDGKMENKMKSVIVCTINRKKSGDDPALKLAKIFIAHIKRYIQKEKITVGILPFQNKDGENNDEVLYFTEQLYGRLFKELRKDENFTVMTRQKFEALVSKHEVLLDSFDRRDAGNLVFNMGLDAVIGCKFKDVIDLKYKNEIFQTECKVIFAEEKKLGEKRPDPIVDIRSSEFSNPALCLKDNENYDLDILVDGIVLPKKKLDMPGTMYHGAYLVEVNLPENVPEDKKKEVVFQIRLTNKLYSSQNTRAGVALLIDGVDCFWQKNSKGEDEPVEVDPFDADRWLLKGKCTVRGWQTNDKSANEFTFVDRSQSVAEGNLRITHKLGAITAYFFQEPTPEQNSAMSLTIGVGKGKEFKNEITTVSVPMFHDPTCVIRILYRTKKECKEILGK